MRNELDYRFSIRRLDRSTDSDYTAALKIYNETTPYEIKTNTNEIAFWLDRKDSTDPFESMFFALYYSENLAHKHHRLTLQKGMHQNCSRNYLSQAAV